MAEPIRVLHIVQRMEAGGTQALLMNIYRNIDRNKVQFDFLVEYRSKQFYDDEIEELGGKVYRFTFREDLNLFKFKKELKDFFRIHNEYKIVHCHAYTVGFFCLREAKKAGIPVRIAHSHNNETVHDYKYLPKYIMQKLFTIYATDLFACSNEAGNYLFKNADFLVLQNAIESQKFIANDAERSNIRTELGIEDKVVIGHVGRMHPQKNQSFLIDIFYEIKQKEKEAVLLLIGTGPDEKKIRDKVEELGLDESVIFLGNRSDMNRIFQSMDVFVFPSLFEGLGIVAIEAQASGIPCVCSDGIPEDVNISPLFTRMYLNQSASEWANTALNQISNPCAHKNMQKNIIESGYDVMSTSKRMQNYYLRKQKEV